MKKHPIENGVIARYQGKTRKLKVKKVPDTGEFKDINTLGLWFCVQCGKWHGRKHGHYGNATCHRITYGQEPLMIIPRGAKIERSN